MVDGRIEHDRVRIDQETSRRKLRADQKKESTVRINVENDQLKLREDQAILKDAQDALDEKRRTLLEQRNLQKAKMVEYSAQCTESLVRRGEEHSKACAKLESRLHISNSTNQTLTKRIESLNSEIVKHQQRYASRCEDAIRTERKQTG